jgi:hypothetical protein
MRAVWQLLSISILNVAALVCGAAHYRANAQTLFQWVQVGPEGTSVVRVVTDNACPKVRFDSGKKATNVRSEINQKLGGVDPAPFPVRVCEVSVPAGSITGTLEEKVLPIALCRDLPDTYLARLGAFGVMVVDGAKAAQYGGDLGKLAEGVRGHLADWLANLPDEVWIATHPPIGGEIAKAQAAGQTKPMPGNLSMVVSGHFHSFHTAAHPPRRP